MTLPRKLLLTTAVPLLVGTAVAVPVGLAFGPAQWQFAAVGFGLCVPTGVAVVVLGHYLIRASAFGRLLAVFVGTFVRLAAAFGGGVAVFALAGPTDRADRIAFWLWVLFAYLTTLVVETALMAGPVGGRGAAKAPVGGGGKSEVAGAQVAAGGADHGG